MSQPILSRWHSQLTVYVSLDGPTVIRSLEPCPGAPFAMHHASWCFYTDGCYTRQVLLRQNQCVRTTTSVPLAQKARPQLASRARALDCLPLGCPHGRAGTAGLVPVAHLVSGAAICPGCAFAPVPAGSALLSHTCPHASMSDLLVSSPRPAPSCLKHLGLHLLLSPLCCNRFGVSWWLWFCSFDCRAPVLSKVPSSSCRPVPRVLPQSDPPGSP